MSDKLFEFTIVENSALFEMMGKLALKLFMIRMTTLLSDDVRALCIKHREPRFEMRYRIGVDKWKPIDGARIECFSELIGNSVFKNPVICFML
jgi:hypothetical protein